MQTEQLTHEEYTNYLAFGEPILPNLYTDNDSLSEWISTLDSTTYPGMTFGYSVAPCMSTAV